MIKKCFDKTDEYIDDRTVTTIISIGILLFLFFGAVAGFIGSVLCEKKYKEAVKEPPSISFIEEDLEDVFLTKNCEFIKADDYLKDGNYFCTVKANGLFFKVEYILTVNARNAEWKFQRYIQISEPKDIIK